MAGDWIKVRTRLLEDPAVFRMADRLSLSVEAVGGHLLRVWSWATDQIIDGNAPGVTAAHLDRIAGVTGMGAAMAEVGWINFYQGGATFPNWERHLAQGAKERALAAKRVAKHRNARGVTESLPEKRREEKKREDTPEVVVSNNPKPADAPPPEVIEFATAASGRRPREATLEQWLAGWHNRGRVSPEFVAAASDFWRARQDSGRPITPASIGALITPCEGFSDAAVIADMRRCSAGGFHYLRPREENGSAGGRPTGQPNGQAAFDEMVRRKKEQR
jgi:hypothetical protein